MRIRIISKLLSAANDPKLPAEIDGGVYPANPIPRIGEKIMGFYGPPPEVLMVGYDYKAGEVRVLVK